MINYNDLVGLVGDKIESYSSHSFTKIDKILLDDGGEQPIAAGYAGKGFSVFVESVEDDTELINEDDGLLTLKLEFVLDAYHDNYLKTLGYTQSAVKTLQQVSGSDFLINKLKPYFTCEVENKFVRVGYESTFTINIE